MPVYDYKCDENDRTVEVQHTMEKTLKTWGELCFVAQTPLGDTDPMAPVKKVMSSPPGVSVPIANSKLKEIGFIKLVKRDDGVYENVTALEHEKRYMKAGDPSSVPDIRSKVED